MRKIILFYFLQILFFSFNISCKSQRIDCWCAVPNRQINYDNSLHPNLEYMTDWWYYDLNLELSFNTNPNNSISNQSRLEILLYRISPTPPKCNKENYSLYYLQYSFNADIPFYLKNQTEYFHLLSNEQLNNLNIVSPDGKWNIIRNKDLNLTKIVINPYIELLINDNNSRVLQGNGSIANGYVNNNPEHCSGSYTTSFMRTNITGKIYGIPVMGIGYNEHVITSIFNYTKNSKSLKLNKEYLGWNCHYMHLNVSDVFLCQTHKKNGQRDAYDHGIILSKDNNDKKIWLTVDDFETIPLKNWTSPNSKKTYTVDWKINIRNNIYYLFTDNLNIHQEVDILFTKNWINNVKIFDNNKDQIGFGISEVYDL